MPKRLAAIAVLGLAIGIAGPASAKGIYKATLDGASEVPPVDTATSGKVFLKPKKGRKQLEFTLKVKRGTGITQAHIHCAKEGENGPIVVWLAGLIETGLDVNGKWISKARFGDDGVVDGTACGDTVKELTDSIRDGNAYVNVHSLANASGEVRGQLTATGKKN